MDGEKGGGEERSGEENRGEERRGEERRGEERRGGKRSESSLRGGGGTRGVGARNENGRIEFPICDMRPRVARAGTGTGARNAVPGDGHGRTGIRGTLARISFFSSFTSQARPRYK